MMDEDSVCQCDECWHALMIEDLRTFGCDFIISMGMLGAFYILYCACA